MPESLFAGASNALQPALNNNIQQQKLDQEAAAAEAEAKNKTLATTSGAAQNMAGLLYQRQREKEAEFLKFSREDMQKMSKVAPGVDWEAFVPPGQKEFSIKKPVWQAVSSIALKRVGEEAAMARLAQPRMMEFNYTENGKPMKKNIMVQYNPADSSFKSIDQGEAAKFNEKSGKSGEAKPPTDEKLQQNLKTQITEFRNSVQKMGSDYNPFSSKLSKTSGHAAVATNAQNAIQTIKELQKRGVAVEVPDDLQQVLNTEMKREGSTSSSNSTPPKKTAFKAGDERVKDGVTYVRGANGKWRPKN